MIDLLQAVETGTGIYTIPEAARYARMYPQTLRSWFAGGRDRHPIRPIEIDSPGFKAITFLDFIEAVAIRSLRVDYRVSLQKIREAVRNAKDKYGVDHPFARRNHRTVLVGNDLHIFLPDDGQNPIQLTGSHVGQKSFQPCIQSYMRDLDFDASGVANLYCPYHFRKQEIILTPRLHFGEPLVRENGYTARTLYNAALAEGSFEAAAEIYEVSIDSVEAAYRYCNQDLTLTA